MGPRHIACPILIWTVTLLALGLVPLAVRAATPGATLPRPGATLSRPSLAQLRPLVGQVVRITLRNGDQLQARILSVWPGVLQVAYANGRRGGVARARIRSVTDLGLRFIPLATQDAADAGRLLKHLGIGLTVGGAVLGGALGAPLFVVGSRQECPGILDCVPPATTAAIFFTALSASALAVGVPLWVAGAVRLQVHGRIGPEAARARRRFRAWGMGLTFTGVGLAAVGGTLLGVGFGGPDGLSDLRYAGAVTGAVGAFLALCVGLPMWVEAARSSPADTDARPRPTGRRTRPVDDPHRLRAWDARYRSTPGGATFAYAWRF